MTELQYPLRFLTKAVYKSVPKVKEVSANRREIISDYMDFSGKPWDSISNSVRRTYAHIVILGDRRPYDIEIDVIIEERPRSKSGYSSSYKEVGTSKELASMIAFNIRNYINQNARKDAVDGFPTN